MVSIPDIITTSIDVHQVMGVTLGFREFHSVHTLPSIPMEESGTFVHGDELPDQINRVTHAHCRTRTWLRVLWKSSCTAVELERHVAAFAFHQRWRKSECAGLEGSPEWCQRAAPKSAKQIRCQVSIWSLNVYQAVHRIKAMSIHTRQIGCCSFVGAQARTSEARRK